VKSVLDENRPSEARIPAALRHGVPVQVRWGLTDVGWSVLAFLLAITVGAAVVSLPVDPDAASFGLGLLGYAVVVAVIVRASYRRGQRSLRADFGLALRPVDVPLGIAVGVLAQLASALYSTVAVAIAGYSPTTGNVRLSDDALWLVLTAVLTVVVAPIVEELWFRGLVLGAVRNTVLRWRGRTQPAEPAQQRRAIGIAALASALLFMALHSGQSADAVVTWVLALSTLTVALLNAVLVVWTGRLGAGIVAHVTFNAVSVGFALAAR
jgi:membrane protease YdiL (CAAX protease family)